MKNIQIQFAIVLLTCICLLSNARSGIMGPVSGHWTKAYSPYQITDDITINTGDTLLIDPGVSILFSSGKSLFVNGTLKALGTSAERIMFDSAQPNQYWGIILFQNVSKCLSELEYCTIQNASSLRELWEWGAISFAGQKLRVTNCLIENNQNDGIWCAYESEQPDDVTVEITNNIIRENGDDGIFTVISGKQAFICRKNQILNNGNYGVNFWYGNGTFENNVVAANSSHGISCNTSTIQLNLVTIANNKGTGIYCEDNSKPTVTNSIIFGNLWSAIELENSTINVAYSDVQNYWDGVGNLALPPQFVNPDADDYHLSPASPCIDGGNPAADYSNEPIPNGQVVNQGAYGNTSEATTSQPNTPEILIKTPKLYFSRASGQDFTTKDLVINNIGNETLAIQSLKFTTTNFYSDLSVINIPAHDSAVVYLF